MDFFHDFQVRRYLLQFMRIFSDIKVRNGPDANGLYAIQPIPILYGDPSSMVAQIIKGNSENTMMPSPMFSAYIDSIKMAPDRRQDTQYVGKVSTIERKFVDGAYTSEPGVRQDVERYMPVPYDLYLKLDCWTTNTTTKLQIWEQISFIFNPSLQLQQNSNLLDWTSIFEVWMEEFIWTNRSIPQGGEMDRDVMSWRFKVPIWINPPAKIKRSTLIAEIVTNVFNVSTNVINGIDFKNEYDPFRNCIDASTPIQIITTVGNYNISVARVNNRDEITLLTAAGGVDPALSWADLIKKYGQITPNISKIRLKLDPNIDISTSDIIGGIAQDPLHQNILFFTPDVDTLPATTILPIQAIIDPNEVMPGTGLPAAVAGQRYLLTSHSSTGEEPAIPPGVSTSPWGSTIMAYPNDIIEYNGIDWKVIFDAKNSIGKNYVINTANNNSQYMFDSTTQLWSYTYYGKYNPGFWRIDGIISSPSGLTISAYE